MLKTEDWGVTDRKALEDHVVKCFLMMITLRIQTQSIWMSMYHYYNSLNMDCQPLITTEMLMFLFPKNLELTRWIILDLLH